MKRIIRILIVMSTICIVLFISLYSNKEGKYVPNDRNIKLKTTSVELREISKQITEKYLSEYTKDSVVKELRLKKFKINRIDEIYGDMDSFGFWVVYSVKPATLNSDWIAGNGDCGAFWITEKSSYVKVKKIDNYYRITDMGTGE